MQLLAQTGIALALAFPDPRAFQHGSLAITAKRRGKLASDVAIAAKELERSLRALLRHAGSADPFDTIWSRPLARTPEVVQEISVNAVRWGARTPLVTQPGRPNPSQLYFIRYMTDYFVETYGHPMRTQVRHLTSIYFPDAQWEDNSEIAKRAPVRSERNR